MVTAIALSVDEFGIAAIVDKPQMPSKTRSSGPNSRMNSCTIGIRAIRTSTPKTDPIAEAVAAAAMAVRGKPFRDRACPSNRTAAAELLPGILNRIPVMDPMNVAPPVSAPNSNSTDSGCQLIVHRIRIADRLAIPIPGRNEAVIAISVPSTGIRIPGQEKRFVRPS